MARPLQTRLERLENPIQGNGKPLSAIFVRPDDQTDAERIAFDAAVRRHELKGGRAVVIGTSSDELIREAEMFL